MATSSPAVRRVSSPSHSYASVSSTAIRLRLLVLLPPPPLSAAARQRESRVADRTAAVAAR